jgi:hypothetical protein
MSIFIRDALGGNYTLQRAVLIIDSQQGRIRPRRNSSDIGPDGFTRMNLVEGDNVSLDVTNDGDELEVRISATAPPHGGVSTINDVGPDSSGNIQIGGVRVDSNGELVVDVDDSIPRFCIALQADTQSTKFGSSTKLALGRAYFDPNDAKYGLSATSTATLYVLAEVTNSSNTAACDLLRQSGAGSPTVVGTPSTTNSTTAALVSVNVSTAFRPGATAGVFMVRGWVGTPNGNDEATFSGAYIEVTP